MSVLTAHLRGRFHASDPVRPALCRGLQQPRPLLWSDGAGALMRSPISARRNRSSRPIRSASNSSAFSAS